VVLHLVCDYLVVISLLSMGDEVDDLIMQLKCQLLAGMCGIF
jgi:hypothetical protein